MAKITFTKLGLKKNSDTTILVFNDQNIEIKNYLSINDKLTLISNVINLATADNSNYINPIKVNIFTALEIMYYYTNISFTDKQKEDVVKLYDLVISSGLMKEILNTIPATELSVIYDGVKDSITSIYQYKQSALGIMEALGTDYKDLELDAEKIKETLANKEGMEFLQEVMSKLG